MADEDGLTVVDRKIMERVLWFARNEGTIPYAHIARDLWEAKKPETHLSRQEVNHRVWRLREKYPWFDERLESVEFGRPLADKQLEALQVFLYYGDAAEAADELGISKQALGQRLKRMQENNGEVGKMIRAVRAKRKKNPLRRPGDPLDAAGSGKHYAPRKGWQDSPKLRALVEDYNPLVSCPVVGPGGKPKDKGPGKMPLADPASDHDGRFARLEQDDLADPKADPKGIRLPKPDIRP